jgi:membrane-associated protease RseP (regulator of RpoE activity)
MTNKRNMTEHETLEELYRNRPVMKPSWGAYLRHGLLLVFTFLTVTVAGTLFPFGPTNTLPESDPQTVSELIKMLTWLPASYAGLIGEAVHKILADPANLAYGLKFSLSLLFILLSHEMGHYIACRIYNVDATLPFFLPTPPMLGPAGTFGAFIKIMSPMPSRRAVFDIGVAGPLAGFIALVPIALAGVATMEKAPPAAISGGGGITFADPLFMQLAGLAFGKDLSVSVGNPFYFAAWVGLLVTALNLIPSGQLDGGHAVYAALGEKIHYWTGRVAFAVMAVLSISGMYFYGSPSGFLVTVILGVMMRVRHPRPWDVTPLDLKRQAIAVVTLVVFVLSFVPFPIQLN